MVETLRDWIRRLNEVYPYPVFLKLENKKCAVIGGGNVALRKIKELLECNASITVIAETPLSEIENLAAQGRINLIVKPYMTGDICNSFLVIAATDNEKVNIQIASDAANMHAIVNVVDKPELCDFYAGAVLKKGPLRIAVSTSGSCPGLAGTIRRELEETYGEEYIEFVKDLGEMRKTVVSDKEIPKAKKESVLSWLIGKPFKEIYLHSGKDKAWEELKKIISS